MIIPSAKEMIQGGALQNNEAPSLEHHRPWEKKEF